MLLLGDIVKKSHPGIFWCLRGLPKAQREAVYTLFAFCRHLTAIMSSSMPKTEKIDLLNTWQEELDNIYDKNVPSTNIGRKIYKNCMRFSLPKDMWKSMLNSALANVNKIVAPSDTEFQTYMYGISVIPLILYLTIVNNKKPEVNNTLAKYVGTAVFLTYMLRNIKDDAINGQMFIPNTILNKYAVQIENPRDMVESKHLSLAREELAETAKINYTKSSRLLAKMNKKDTLVIRLLQNTSFYLFEIMQKRSWEVISPKPRLSWFLRLKILYRTLIS
ncbi:MAG: squalene/phytoene synthase family protein [Alphaproteobacteria bacterium]|nr:squalene/phytoene synthase family protein [Alphaproteobacteria bacterium]